MVAMGGRSSVDDSIEAVVLVSGVVNSSDWAVRFDQAVRSLDDISVAGLMLRLHVSGVVVVDSVFVGVFGVCLWVDGSLVDKVSQTNVFTNSRSSRRSRHVRVRDLHGLLLRSALPRGVLRERQCGQSVHNRDGRLRWQRIHGPSSILGRQPQERRLMRRERTAKFS